MVVGHEHELRGLLTYWEEERSSVHVYVVINVVRIVRSDWSPGRE